MVFKAEIWYSCWLIKVEPWAYEHDKKHNVVLATGFPWYSRGYNVFLYWSRPDTTEALQPMHSTVY